MTRIRIFAVLFFETLSCAAQTSVLYDNFEHRFLNPSLWNTSCYTTSLSQECATIIQHGKLRLARRITGNTDSNTGLQFGSASAFFFNPAPIKSITTDLVVRDVEESPCVANPGFGGFAAVLARFFNAGSGDPSDDVGASLHFGRVSSDPKGQLTVLAVSFHNGNYSFIWLGNVLLGTPVTATLTWDQANHQFLFSWTNSVTHVKTNGAMPYSFSDTTPAADPTKSLELELFPANCTARQTWVYTDARFDNVYIGQ